MDLKKYTSQLLICLACGAVGVYGGYVAFSNPPEISAKPEQEMLLTVSAASETALQENVITDNVLKITPSTKMVYEYYYEDDGVIETTEEIPPYFLIDMSEQDLEKSFTEWDVTKFTDKEVIMRKTLLGKSTQYYVIGEHEGYVAVFYQMEVNGTCLKEITDTPLSALATEERERLKEGIHIFGDDALLRVLEDYES